MTSTGAGRIHRLVAAIKMVGLFTLQVAAQQSRAAVKLWDNANGGLFSEPANWFGGVPGTNDFARFETTDSSFFQRTYTVDFTTDISNEGLVVEDDGVTFNLMGHTYQPASATVLLGTVPGRSGNLTVKNGSLSLLDSAKIDVAVVAGGSGALTVGASGRVLRGIFTGGPGVRVGVNGNGALDISSGGFVRADLVTIGVNHDSTGTVTVSGFGSLDVINDINFSDAGSGTLRINKGGRVFVGGNLDFFGDDEVLDLEVGQFSDTSKIRVGKQLLLGGKLLLSLESGFVPRSDAKFELIATSLGIFGSFANVSNGERLAVDDGSFLVNYGPESPFNPTSVFISSYLQATPGDFDVDGNVDGTDILFWQRGDSPNHGNVADLTAWKVNFGTTGAAASSAVPELSGECIALAAIGLAGNVRRVIV